MSYSEILYDVQGATARITLNRPEKRNPLGPHDHRRAVARARSRQGGRGGARHRPHRRRQGVLGRRRSVVDGLGRHPAAGDRLDDDEAGHVRRPQPGAHARRQADDRDGQRARAGRRARARRGLRRGHRRRRRAARHARDQRRAVADDDHGDHLPQRAAQARARAHHDRRQDLGGAGGRDGPHHARGAARIACRPRSTRSPRSWPASRRR